MYLIRIIPNLITCGSLAFGFQACLLAATGDTFFSMVAVIAAAFLDFADGLAARLLKAYSPIGKDLDSLADVISFGVAPGITFYHYIMRVLPDDHPFESVPVMLAALIPIFSAIRLARFNHDKRQTDSFIGLPVPAHALLWMSLIDTMQWNSVVREFIASLHYLVVFWALFALVAVTTHLMVSEVRMLSFKMKTYEWKGNQLRYIFIGLAAILTLCWYVQGLLLTMLLYIAFSLFNRRK